MKKSGLLIAIAVAVLVVLGVLLLNRQHNTAPLEMAGVKTPVTHTEDPKTATQPLKAEDAAKASSSAKQMTSLLAETVSTEKNLDTLVSDLKKQNQEPYLVHDKNPYTGEMTIVRTKSPLPGTRYFHAQYFTDENGKSFAQHVSFELRGSPEAMANAMKIVEESFPGLGKPSEETRDFVQWELPNGYVVWIKRLDQQDLTNNPFNAYTPADVGSIRIAVELTPEGD